MQKHTKVYFKHFGLGEQSDICCEICGKGGRADKAGFDLHHLTPRSQGGKDVIENLILLCRKCHNRAHDETINKAVLKARHEIFMEANL